MDPKTYAKLMGEFNAFFSAFCDVKEGDRFQLKREITAGPRGNRRVIAENEKGTVIDVTVSGMAARILMRFDNGVEHWAWSTELSELCVLDRLAEL